MNRGGGYDHSTVEILAPAKINLTLTVLAREASGFHQLESLFQMVSLADRLRVRRIGKADPDQETQISLEVTGAELGPMKDNLVFRAARAFLDATDPVSTDRGSVRIELEKRIPHGAGLGGGSSDAAATLRCLDRLFPDRVPKGELVRIAASIGADVPFFLSDEPLAWGWSRGDRILPLPPLTVRTVVLILPDSAISTPEAYRWLAEAHEERPSPRPPSTLHERDSARSWVSVAERSENSFEPVVFSRFKELSSVREALVRAGAEIARLSGSGSALFGVFDRPEKAEEVAHQIEERFPGVRTEVVRTLDVVPALEFIEQGHG